MSPTARAGPGSVPAIASGTVTGCGRSLLTVADGPVVRLSAAFLSACFRASASRMAFCWPWLPPSLGTLSIGWCLPAFSLSGVLAGVFFALILWLLKRNTCYNRDDFHGSWYHRCLESNEVRMRTQRELIDYWLEWTRPIENQSGLVTRLAMISVSRDRAAPRRYCLHLV